MIISPEQILPINGVQLWTAIEGEGTPTVLCHGGPGGYDYLAPVADMISDVCRVVRYDQRGNPRFRIPTICLQSIHAGFLPS